MSDREFTGFDVDTVVDAVRQPPLDDLWLVARARGRRRSVGVALVLMVAMVGMAFGPVVGRLNGAGPADPDDEVEIRSRGTQLFVLDAQTAVGVEVTGYGCTIRFTRTSDGGRSWTDFQPARYGGTCRPESEGKVSSHVEYAVLGERSYLISIDNRVYLSIDAGRTWRDADSAMLDVTAFPAGARPVRCQVPCDLVRRMMAVDPVTGRVYRLSGYPPSPYPPSSVDEGRDGALWATFWAGDGKPSTIAVSFDRGATWRTSRAPVGMDISVAAVRGQAAYLLTEPLPAEGTAPPATGSSRLLHTTDGGRTWTDVGTDLPTSNGMRPFTVGSDGALLVGDVDPDGFGSFVRVSRDGGRHFTRGEEVGEDGGVGAGRGFVWLYGRDDRSLVGPDHVQLTADGVEWTRFPLPE